METQEDKTNTPERLQISTTHGLGEERNLPIIKLDTKNYLVDIANGELRSVDDPQRTIQFHAMARNGDEFSFLYDKGQDKAIISQFDKDNFTKAQWIKLPAIETLDPEFNLEIRLDEASVKEKIFEGTSVYDENGKLEIKDHGSLLPVINLYGTDFFLDLRLKEFREVANPYNAIPWKAVNSEELHHSLLYDSKRKNAFQGTSLEAKEFSHVKFLFLPPIDIIVSEGIARHKEMQKEKNKNVIEVRVEKKRKFKR